MNESRRIVVLDRHPMWLDAICDVLDRLGVDVVGATTDPEVGLETVRDHQPDLVLLDPGETEWRMLIRPVLDAAPGAKVLGISASDDPELIESTFAAGACAYLVKTASELDIDTALRLALTSAIYVAGPVRDTVQGELHDEVADTLTRRELEILRLVALGHSNAALGQKLWVTEQTVKFHLSNVYRKIGVQNRTAAARWASLHGILPNGDEEHEGSSQAVGFGTG